MDPDSNQFIQLLSVGTSTDTNSANVLIYLLILVVLIFANGFFAASEMAMVTLNDAKLKLMSEDGNRKAKLVQKLLNQPTKFLASIQVGVTVAGFMTSAVAADKFAEPLSNVIYSLIKTRYDLIHSVVLILLTVLLAFISIVFGEMVPKRIAMNNPERVSFAFAPVLMFFYKFSKPAIFILSKTTNGTLRLLGINPNAQPEEVTEEEIMMMVDVGKENGVIEESQKDMIAGIFEFDDTTADEVMTHRTEIVAVEINSHIDEVISYTVNEGYSRIPVYEDDLDNIVGVVYVKDLLKYVGKNIESEITIKDCMRKALYIPKSIKLREVFTKLTENRMQMAIVVDEYGGTAGIITMEDLLESIVGNMQDEFDDEEEEISRESDTVFTIEGTAPLDEVAPLLDITIPDDTEYDTIGGFLTGLLERIPDEDENPEIEFDYVKFTVLSVEERRIASIRAEKLPRPEVVEEDDDE
ncbi:MAG: HlyC/CorC family transporter [Oscillospiraceae bacterium]|nr:HlyC/CorC family transporter [Oscillospiraceae bacterium]